MQRRKKVYVNIKVDTETAQRFKECSKKTGQNHSTLLNEMIELHEMQSMLFNQDPITNELHKVIKQAYNLLEADQKRQFLRKNNW